MSIDIGGMRKPYNDEQHCFDIKDLKALEPVAQFKAWFDEATSSDQIGKIAV
jgi:pyridoxine/pyridoxamine 5'-phosphate oxidase